jgi:hypothetical protein
LRELERLCPLLEARGNGLLLNHIVILSHRLGDEVISQDGFQGLVEVYILQAEGYEVIEAASGGIYKYSLSRCLQEILQSCKPGNIPQFQTYLIARLNLYVLLGEQHRRDTEKQQDKNNLHETHFVSPPFLILSIFVFYATSFSIYLDEF